MLQTFLVDAILFDMDGTLIDSTPGVLKAWHTFAKEYSFNATAVIQSAHGRRLLDTLRECCKIDDQVKLKAEVDRFEALVLDGGMAILPGSLYLLSQLASQAPLKWTIVTSATSLYASRALELCNLPMPLAGYVTSNDVSRGKPHPDPYVAGATKCSVDPVNCLVVEDATSGLKAGRAAGAKTLAVCTTHTRQEILDSDANPDFIVKDLTQVSARWIDGKVEVTINDEATD